MSKRMEVERDLRARKSGLALRTQHKQESRYDEEDKLGVPVRVVKWINESLGDEIKPLEQNRNWRDIQYWLRDGVIICTLMNKLLTAKGLPTIKFKKNAHTHFVALENISQFCKGAKSYGVPDNDLFDAIDLYESQKGPFLNPIKCLNRLGQIANANEFTPVYEVVKPTLDSDYVGMLE